nr:JmjC domain-containing protein [Tanacetum cinerariifolium]
MPLLAHMLVVPAGGDGAGAAASHDVPPPPPPPIVPPTHSSSSTPGPSNTAQATHMREPTPEPTPDSLRPLSPSLYPRSEEVGPTTSTRPPSPTRQTSFQEYVSEGGGDFVSSPKSNEAPQTPMAIAAGGAEDSAALTALSLKLDTCINRVTSLKNELGVTKKVLSGVVLNLVTRVKRLEGLLQQRKRRLVLSDSEGEEVASKEQDIDLDALHKLASTSLGAEVPADTTMPFRRTSTTQRLLRKPFTSSSSVYFLENTSAVEDTLPAGEGIPTAALTISIGSTTILAGSSMDTAVHAAAAAPSSTIPAANKGKAPMVNDSLPADLLSEQERILKNLHDYQLGEDFTKKLHAKQEAEFARQQEELAHKAQAKSVALPTEQDTGLSDHHRRELDVAQLIYTKADWLELMAKIATNSALSKQLLGADVNEENMNERLGMLLMRKRRELAEQSRVKPINKTQQRDYMRDFVKNQSAFVYNQGWTMKQVKALSLSPAPSLEAPSAKWARQVVPQDVHAASLQVPASVPAIPSVVVAVSVLAALSVSADVLVLAVPPDLATVSANVATVVHAEESTPDDNPTASEQVAAKHTVAASTPSSLRKRHTKHFTSLCELLYMVEKNDLQKLLGVVDTLYQREEPDTFALLLWGDLHVHVLETVDGRVIYMFVDVSYPLSAATLTRMLKHGLEVPKLLVGRDLTMDEQLTNVKEHARTLKEDHQHLKQRDQKEYAALAGTSSKAVKEDNEPALILDDSCAFQSDLSLSLLGKLKEFSSLPNLKTLLAVEGFDDTLIRFRKFEHSTFLEVPGEEIGVDEDPEEYISVDEDPGK